MTTTATHRGTTNGNQRGGSEDRRRRRAYLLDTYRADVDGMWFEQMQPPDWNGITGLFLTAVPFGTGIPVCRCYRCGVLLDDTTVTVDRIVPGCKGGTYKRANIRPACGRCNSQTGAVTRR
jgi:5-methylcytosine-specific restriction endonuclease McrA